MVAADAIRTGDETVAADLPVAAWEARLCRPGFPLRFEELGYRGFVVGRRVF